MENSNKQGKIFCGFKDGYTQTYTHTNPKLYLSRFKDRLITGLTFHIVVRPHFVYTGSDQTRDRTVPCYIDFRLRYNGMV